MKDSRTQLDEEKFVELVETIKDPQLGVKKSLIWKKWTEFKTKNPFSPAIEAKFWGYNSKNNKISLWDKNSKK